MVAPPSDSRSDSSSAILQTSAGHSADAGSLVPMPNGVHKPEPSRVRPEILSITPRPIDLAYALRRRWGWALGAGLVCAVATVAVAWLAIPVNYTAKAWLRIAEDKPKIMFDTGSGDEFLTKRQAQATLMTSNFVLNAALRKPGVSQLEYLREEIDPVTWLQKNIRVAFPGNSEILQISMTGDDPVQLVKLVNAVKDAYMEEVVSVDRESHLRRKRVLELSYHRNTEEIKRKAYVFKDLADELGTSDSAAAKEKEAHALQSQAELRSRANNIRSQVGGMDRRIQILKARLERLTGEGDGQGDEDGLIARLLEMAMAQDAWIAQAIAQIRSLDAAIFEQKLRAAREDAPSIGRLQERQQQLTESIQKRREEIGPQLLEEIRDQVAKGFALAPPTPADEIRAEIERIEMEKAVMEEEQKVAMEDFQAAADEAIKMGTESADLEAKRTELTRLKKITGKMGEELEEWEIELAAAPRVSLLEAATVPRSNDIDKKYRTVIVSGVAAFLIGVMGIAAIDFLSRRVNSPAEVAYGLGVQVMGDVPLMSSRSWRSAASVNGGAGGSGSPWHGMMVESIDNIRTALLHRAHSESLQVVMVTSSLAKEGKTTLSTQLAASLARSGRRTLLLDGDLRRPNSHRMFELPVNPGISELLRGEAGLDDVIRPTRVAGLWMAPAGVCDQEAIQALAQDALHEVFKKLRAEFDFILIDSGPVLTDADALLFGHYSDAVILSVLRDVSRVPRVFEAIERLRAVDIPLLGAVINGVGISKYRAYYRPYSIQVESTPV